MLLKDQIYLLEVQVIENHLESVKELEVLDKQEVKMYAHFLSFERLLIYDEFTTNPFRGQPILFKMSPAELTNALDRSALTISVVGMLNDEGREYTIGTVKILFTEAFIEAITLATTSVMYPVTAQLEELFPFRNLYHEESGSVSVVVKLSCFGNVDINRLANCNGKEQARESIDVVPQNEGLDKDNNTLKAIVTDMDQQTPATTVPIKKDDIIKGAIPWKMANEQPFGEQERPRPQQRYENELPKQSEGLVCTCDSIPQFMNQRSPPPAKVKCECAEILAAMKNAFPCSDNENSAKYQPAEVQSQPPQTMNQISRANITQPNGNMAPPAESTRPPAPPPDCVPQAPAGDDIVPTSAVCGLELKPPNNNLPVKSMSEERVHQQQSNKQELKATVSNSELTTPRPVEDSSKKFMDKELHNWDERKQVIKKEYKTKNKKARDIYEYTAGMYPGMVIGHKYCIPTIRLVPRNMGWMWNMLELYGRTKKNKGWRPGAIIKTVANNFGSWNRAAGFKEGDDVDSYFNFKKKKGAREAETLKEAQQFKPTLHVHKKNKFYHVTVNPPGQSNVKPLTFKVDPRKGSSDEETSSESTSDDSFEFEYTVPAGLVPPPRKVEWANQNTQYNILDFSPKKKPEQQQAAAVEEPSKERKDSKKGKGKGDKGKKKK